MSLIGTYRQLVDAMKRSPTTYNPLHIAWDIVRLGPRSWLQRNFYDRRSYARHLAWRSAFHEVA
jgi:hypothetical protein